MCPRRERKKVAHGGGSLVRAMGITALSVDPMSEAITTVSGKPVEKFIDYVPATEQDIANIRPMDVKRVELLEYPSDPRFRGAEYVLNFIMVKYEYGGYTKLDADQNIMIDNGAYNVNSKLTCGKMTYDAAANFNYKRSTHDGSTQKTIYRFPGLEITREKDVKSSDAASRSGYGTLRATYASDKTLITNSVGVWVSKTPYVDIDYATGFSPMGIFANGVDRQYRTSSSASPSWRGSYLWYLPKKYSLTVDPSLSYGHYTTGRVFSTQNEDITSFATDNSLNYRLVVTAQKQFGKHNVSLQGSLNGKWNETSYEGSTASSSRFNEVNTDIMGRIRSNFGSGWLMAHAILTCYNTKFDNYRKTQIYPVFFIGGGYTFKNKHRITATAQLAKWTIPVSRQMPNFVLTSQIDAVQGNEALRHSSIVPITLNYDWFVSKVLSLSLYTNYYYYDNTITEVYLPMEFNGKPLMVQGFENRGFYSTLSYGASMGLRLFKNSLMLNGRLGGVTANRREGINRQGTYLSYNLSADYRFKNFYCNLTYKSATESIGLSSYTKAPDYYYLCAGWSSGNFNASAFLINPFNSGWKHIYMEDGDRNYMNCSQGYGTGYHRHVLLRLSYSFSYGKKVKQTEGIGSMSGSESGIL